MNKRLLMSLAVVLSTMGAMAQQKVKDGTATSGNLPNKDALLELESNNKGLLHARVALVESINPAPLSAHVAGMMVYNTATSKDVIPGIYYNDGSKWVFVKGTKGDPGTIIIEGKPGTTGTPGTPGQPGGPGPGTTIVTNDSGTWIYNPTTNTWTNINGPKGDQGAKGDPGTVGVQGLPGTSGTPGTPGSGTPGAPGAGITVVTNDSGTWVYNPTTNTWTNINGPKGDKGDKGDAGVVGVQGLPGTSGTPGTPGSGTPGAPGAGITVVTNDSGTWVYNSTTNTWTNINGPKGDKGDAGVVGVQGLPGTSGTPGAPGSGTPGAPGTGITVVTNDSGTWVYNPTTNTWTNINGPKGDKGDAGVVGVQGLPGTSGTPGTPGSGTPGAPGTGITVVTNDSGTWVYNPTTNTWTNINGPKGNKGDAGVVGVQGLPGTSGTPGTPGSGTPGAPGAGITVVTNDSGTWVYNPTTNTWTNINGPKGDIGLTGPAGAVGATGPAGLKGDTGAAGAIGPKGDIGLTGPAGAVGATGPAGPKGDTGAAGAIGPVGPSGITTITNEIKNPDNTITSTVNGISSSTKAVNTVVNTLNGTSLVTTVNGVAGTVDIAPAINAGQKTTTVIAGTNVTVSPATPNPTGNTQYTVGVPTANGNSVGVVKQQASNPVVTINAAGELGINANSGLSLSTTDGNIQLGGSLVKATTISTGTNLLTVATGGANTMAITGLTTGAITDQVVVADANGILKQVTGVMPKFFYMPSVIVPTASDQFIAEPGITGESFGTINLYARYSKQFGTPAVRSSGAPALPVIASNQLYYYITWFDTTVFSSVNVSATGILTYTVLPNADVTSGAFMNIVFAVK